MQIFSFKKCEREFNKTRDYCIKPAYYVITFFITTAIQAQSKESLAASDTVYIHFNYKEYQYKSILAINRVSRDTTFMYQFKYDKTNYFNLFRPKFFTLDDEEVNKPADVKTLEKDFFKKNKNIIIDIDYLLENGFRETFLLVHQKKLYLIDESETKGRKAKARQILLGISSYIDE